MKKYLLLLSLFGAFAAHAQSRAIHDIDVGLKEPPTSNAPKSAAPKVYTYADQMPMPQVDVATYIKKHLHYPELAKKNHIEGRVVTRFVVNEDGSMSNIQVLRGIGGGCDEEAVRVLKSLPKWKPGKQNGKNVKVYFTLPVSFVLSEADLQAGNDTADGNPREGKIYEYTQLLPQPTVNTDIYMREHLKYPEVAKKNHMEGPVVLKFVVNKDGSLSDIQVLRGIGGGCDEEAIRLVKSMPKWIPGKMFGKNIRVHKTLTVMFHLQ